jgi:VIT1/CCC1 family predicted Fe2+/Mn2+ transporter
MAEQGPVYQHENEPHRGDLNPRLNRLRAGVLGANDGIVSVAAIVVGVAGATTQTGPILTAGMAGLVGGAVSMVRESTSRSAAKVTASGP